MAGAALVNLFRRLRMVLLTWSPSQEEDSEIDRAGRMGELKVSDVFRKVSGVQVFESLRIPDSENRGRREIDLVLLTKRKIYVVEVKNWSGVIKLERDGGWCQLRKNGSTQKHPDIVKETRHRALLLEAYLLRRGADLPPMSIDFKVFLVNSECRPEQAILMQPEVLDDVNWQYLLNQDQSVGYSTWLGSLFSSSTKGALRASIHEQLQFILSTTPTWDRMQLEGGKNMVGDFLQFKGRAEDLQALKLVKRPNVSNLAMVHSRSILPNLIGVLVGIHPTVKIIVTVRDFREKVGFLGMNQRKETIQVKVNPDLQIIFRNTGTSVTRSVKVNNVVNLSFSV